MTPRKIPFGTQLPPQLVDEVRRTVVDLQRADPSMTIARFVEIALTKALDDLPSAVKAMPAPAGRPRPGRRVTTSDERDKDSI